MGAISSWGKSWGKSWGNAWGKVDSPTATAPSPSVKGTGGNTWSRYVIRYIPPVDYTKYDKKPYEKHDVKPPFVAASAKQKQRMLDVEVSPVEVDRLVTLTMEATAPKVPVIDPDMLLACLAYVQGDY